MSGSGQLSAISPQLVRNGLDFVGIGNVETTKRDGQRSCLYKLKADG